MDTYDSKMASRIVGVSLRQTPILGRARISSAVGASWRTAGAPKRLYSFHDLVCLKVVKDLARHGFSLQKIRRCLQPLKDNTVANPATVGFPEIPHRRRKAVCHYQRPAKNTRRHGTAVCVVARDRQSGA